MAFSLQYLQRVYSSVDLNKVSNPTVGESVGIGPSVWTYSAAATGGSNDSAATVEASGYFNGATGYVSNGDMIYAVTNDPGYHILAVSSATGASTVTTSTLV